MMSREADLYERAFSAERDLEYARELQISTSWERMVLLACWFRYADGFGVVMPRQDKEHDLEMVDASLEIMRRYEPLLEPDPLEATA